MEINLILDSSKVQNVLKTLDAGFRDFTPLLEEIGKVQLDWVDETFKVRGKNLWMPWERLKLATVKQKIRVGKNVDILQRSGKMKKSFQISKITKNELTIENKLHYFKYHQTGTKKMPQRQMLGHSAPMIKRHEIAYMQYVLNLIKEWTK